MTAEANAAVKQHARLSADDWSEGVDLIDQCVQAADIDQSYSRSVRDKAMAMMTRVQNEAVDNALRKRDRVDVVREGAGQL